MDKIIGLAITIDRRELSRGLSRELSRGESKGTEEAEGEPPRISPVLSPVYKLPCPPLIKNMIMYHRYSVDKITVIRNISSSPTCFKVSGVERAERTEGERAEGERAEGERAERTEGGIEGREGDLDN